MHLGMFTIINLYLQVRMLDDKRISGKIVEAEAYLGMCDLTSHVYMRRNTKSKKFTEHLYKPGGHVRTYMVQPALTPDLLFSDSATGNSR